MALYKSVWRALSLVSFKLLYYFIVASGIADKGILNYYATRNLFGAFKHDQNNPAARINE